MKTIQLNEEKFGFKLVKVTKVEDINATLYQYKHIKSGGLVLHLYNDDTNCGAAFGFRTCPQDSTGVCHIIEHSLLCGSKKFPLKEPFVNLLKTSLNTFLNAFTAYDWTMYPFSSQVPKDFDNVLQIYADAVFNPAILYDKRPFLQEGWHLELNNIDDTPSYKGVVYNEMKGAMSSVSEMLTQATLEAMYKDSFYRFNSGGDPDVIPELTYEDYVAFYKKHYNPQNCMTFFYGDMEILPRLEFLDKEYFSKYDKSNEVITISPQKPHINLNYKKSYEIGEDEEEKDNTYFSLCYGLDHYSNVEDFMAMNMLYKTLLGSNEAPVKKALLDAKLGQDVGCSIDDDNIIPALHIYLEKSNPECKEKFKEVFESEIRKQVENGIDKKALLATINRAEFKEKEMDMGKTPKGIVYAMTLMQNFNYNTDFMNSLDTLKYYEKFREELNTNYFENILRKYILESKHNVEVMLTPDKTLGKKKKEAMDAKMNHLKETMSKEEKEFLVNQTKDLIAYQNHVDTKEELATLPKLALKDIPSKINYLDSKEITVANTKGIYHKVNTNQIGYLRMFFEINCVSFEDLPYVYLLKELLVASPTSKYETEELRTLIKTYLGSFSVSESPITPKGKPAKLLYLVNVSALKDNIKYIPDIVNQVLLHTKFNKKVTLTILKQLVNNMKQVIINNGMSIAMLEAQAPYSDSAAISTNGMLSIKAYNFYNNLVKNFNFKEIKAKLDKISKDIFAKKNCFFSISGDNKTANELKKAFRHIKLSNNQADNILVINRNKVCKDAFVIPSGVSYCALSNSMFNCGYEYNGKYQVVGHIVRLDYLWPEVRVKGGAYGCTMSFSPVTGCVTFGSYRDPNVKNTYEIFKNLPNYLRNFKVSKSEFVSYIIGAMGGFDMPGSIPSLIAEWDNNYIANYTKEDKIKDKKEILSTTLKDINEAADMIEKTLVGACEFTVGNEAKIKEYPFDKTTNLQ